MMKSAQPENGCQIYLESRYNVAMEEYNKKDTINGKQ